MSFVSRTRKGALSRALSLMTLLVLTVAMTPMAAPSATAVILTYWVDDDGSDANPGTEALPFKTITHAFDVAGFSDTIMVKPGIYDTANGETFPLAGGGETLKSTGGAEVTTIQGDGVNRLLGSQNFTEGDVISGFTFAGGMGSGAAITIYLNWATGPDSPAIEDNVFVGNDSVSFDGGALTLFTSGPGDFRPLVRGNEFRGNNAGNAGGAIRMNGYIAATVTDNLFAENTARMAGALTITSQDSTVTITDNVFRSNEATSGKAGAVYLGCSGDQAHTIARNTFEGNSAASEGGALWLFGATIDLYDNEAYGNDATGFGGFARSQDCTINASNNVLVGNTGGSVAAWDVSDGALFMNNDTLRNNTGSTTAVYASGAAVLEIENSILWNPLCPVDVMAADALSYSCVYDPAATGTGVMHDDPEFANPLAVDGRLGAGSPCIDSANAATAETSDFFGTARPVDGDGTGGAAPDMGFHEFVPPSPDRLSDRTRYSTAVAIAEESFPAWTDVTNVIIACGDDRAAADPLAASGLCWAYDAPMLLVGSKSTPSEVKVAVKQIVDANGPVTLRVVGGPVSVPDARINEIKAYAGAASVTSDRLLATGGRYDLARAIANRMKIVAATDPDKTLPDIVLFANGADQSKFFDALALSPIAAAQGAPILLVKADSVPPATTVAIADLGNPPTRIVGGGKNTVSESVRIALGATRWSGRSRYDTAIAIANGAVSVGWLNRQTVGVAAKLPDALTGGSFVGRKGGVLLLTDGGTLTAATNAWLLKYKAQVLGCYVFGGELSVKPSVVTAIGNALD